MKSLPDNIDYTVLAQVTDEDTMRCTASCKKLCFAQHRHKFTRVAFDMFREDATSSLWQLTQDDGGEEWLVRSDMSDASSTQSEEIQETTQAWSAVPHKNGQAVTLTYQKIPVTLFKGQQFGFKPHEAHMFCGFLVSKLGSLDFQKQLIGSLPTDRRQALQQQHPELFV